PGCPGALKPTNSLNFASLLACGSSVSWLGCSLGNGLLVVFLLGLLGSGWLWCISWCCHRGCSWGSGGCRCWCRLCGWSRRLCERCNGHTGQKGGSDQGLDIQHGLKLTHLRQSHKLRP